LRLEYKKSDQSKIYSDRQDIMTEEEKSVSPLAPLSNAVTKILCSVFEYESGFCVMNTIITKLNKKLLKCNIPTAVSPNNGPPFSKGKLQRTWSQTRRKTHNLDTQHAINTERWEKYGNSFYKMECCNYTSSGVHFMNLVHAW